MLEFADEFNAKLSGRPEDYRTFAHRNTTIANESTRSKVGIRLLHQDLIRAEKAQLAAIILLMSLLLVLIAPFYPGVSLLRA
jgi:hypothetical protein